MMKVFGGPDICGTGFAVGMERLVSLAPFTREAEDFLYLAFLGDEAQEKGMALARFLRQNDLECLIEYKERSLRNQISRANKLGARWVLIVGEEEIKSGKYQLKNMATGNQVEVGKEDIIKVIRESA